MTFRCAVCRSCCSAFFLPAPLSHPIPLPAACSASRNCASATRISPAHRSACSTFRSAVASCSRAHRPDAAGGRRPPAADAARPAVLPATDAGASSPRPSVCRRTGEHPPQDPSTVAPSTTDPSSCPIPRAGSHLPAPGCTPRPGEPARAPLTLADPEGSATDSIFGYSITEQLRAAKASQSRSSGTGRASGPTSSPRMDPGVDGPSL